MTEPGAIVFLLTFTSSDEEFRVEGQYAQRKVGKNWETIGYFIPLSTAQANKSIAYPMYTIIFDEFIIDKGSLRCAASDEAKYSGISLLHCRPISG